MRVIHTYTYTYIWRTHQAPDFLSYEKYEERDAGNMI